MKIKGKIAIFDKILPSGDMFCKDTEINIPEKVLLSYDFASVATAIGTAEVKKTDTGLEVIGNIPYYHGELIRYFSENCGLGGLYYNTVFSDYIDTDTISYRKVRKADLAMVSIVSNPLSPDYKFEIIEDPIAEALKSMKKLELVLVKPFYDDVGFALEYRPPEEIKRDIKYEKNPMRLKQLNQELNASYKFYKRKK